jgi:TetR/AcrR family transcriptional regulator, repressor of fatR-cypB operon
MNVPSSRKGGAPKSAGSRDRTQENLRAAILDAALHAFAERGFHGTNVPDIAKAAAVGVGSMYRHFESKERLVNAVFRRAKGELRDALLFGLDFGRGGDDVFRQVWSRLVRFHREHPLSFQFLEMQDHVPYLDAESRQLERSLLEPLYVATEHLKPPGADLPSAVMIALVWGAFVGLTKAERLGYLALDEATYIRAGEVCLLALNAKLPTLKQEDSHASNEHPRPRAPRR